MKNSTIYIIVAVVLLGGLGIFFFIRNRKNQSVAPQPFANQARGLRNPPVGLTTVRAGTPSGAVAVTGNLSASLQNVDTGLNKVVNIVDDVGKIIAAFGGKKTMSTQAGITTDDLLNIS